MRIKKHIFFDMDGTIADLYQVNGWLELLDNEDTLPYEVAKPMIDLHDTSLLLKQLQAKGYKIGVISWLSKNGTKQYNKKVTQAKRKWLKDNIDFKFNSIKIVKYGTPKHKVARAKGIIFDDDVKVRNSWNGTAINPHTTDINAYLLMELKGL